MFPCICQVWLDPVDNKTTKIYPTYNFDAKLWMTITYFVKKVEVLKQTFGKKVKVSVKHVYF